MHLLHCKETKWPTGRWSRAGGPQPHRAGPFPSSFLANYTYIYIYIGWNRSFPKQYLPYVPCTLFSILIYVILQNAGCDLLHWFHESLTGHSYHWEKSDPDSLSKSPLYIWTAKVCISAAPESISGLRTGDQLLQVPQNSLPQLPYISNDVGWWHDVRMTKVRMEHYVTRRQIFLDHIFGL